MADRHRFRAGWHDYNCGIYFVTICCANARHYFGEIEDGNMALSPVGIIAESQIQSLSSHFANVEICNYVVMPNHVHVVIAVNPVDTRANVPENPPVGSMFVVQFKKYSMPKRKAYDNKFVPLNLNQQTNYVCRYKELKNSQIHKMCT